MKKIKLRDITPKQWDKNKDSLCKLYKGKKCDSCIFELMFCTPSSARNSWINHKDMYSDKILNQKVEIDILNKAEKEYLSNVIKPFRDRVISIEKVGYNDNCFISIIINGTGKERINLPFFKEDTMYQGMESDKEYTIEVLGL